MRALKLVSLAATGPAAFERAQREARILAAAAHPSLVACHGLFEDPRAGLVGLVMDLVPGETLADIAARERLDGEHLDAVIAQIADVLAYIHGRGLVHRDLKPENVLVTDRFRAAPRAPGAIKLVDFGIAVPASNPHRLTATGVVIGTLPYLAPELVDPASWGRTEGPARDVFAFGVMAYHLRFGKHPTRLGPGATLPLGEASPAGGPVTVMIRQEDVQIVRPEQPHGLLAEVETRIFLGSRIRYVLAIGPHRLRCLAGAERVLEPGDTVAVRIAPDAIRVLER